MKLLLDTSVLLHYLAPSRSASSSLRSVVEDDRNVVFFSPLSIWEVRVKEARGKLRVDPKLVEVIRSKGFAGLSFTVDHAEEVRKLPPIHADPFDRGLIAQARCELMTILTEDATIQRYEVSVERV